MKNPLLFSVALIIQTSLLSGQTDVKIAKRDFKTVKQGFNAAWEHVKLGDSFYSEGGVWYAKALDEYRQALRYNSENAELNYKTGVSSLFSDNKDKASEYLLKAYKMKEDVAQDILLLTGVALQYAGRYQEAADNLEAYISTGVKKPERSVEIARKRLEESKNSLLGQSDTLNIEIQNLENGVNTDADEFSPVLSSDERKLYFASRRALTPGARNYYADTKFDENIFVSEKIDDKWNQAILAGKNITTSLCETPLFIDKTGEVLFIYVGYEGAGNVKYSEFMKGEWKASRNEPFGLNTSDPETSFCLSPSGNEIAFVSIRGKNGVGGKDIYFMKLNGKKWSKPVNAGQAVNSRFNEESVRFSKTGDTIWFSSSGHNTAGGYDIFFSVRNEKGEWGKAVNAGYPLNTAWDEFFYVPSMVDNSIFYFVSNRSGGFGGLDIYCGKMLKGVKKTTPQPPGTLKQDTLILKDTTSAAGIVGLLMGPDISPPVQEANNKLRKNIASEGLKNEEVVTAFL
jgi:tetratricopeptide (TPR) repeat protein